MALLFGRPLSNWTQKLRHAGRFLPVTSNRFCSDAMVRAATATEELPIRLEGTQYLPNPKFHGDLPRLDRLNYVDSDIKFLNFHSDGLGMAFSSDYDHCVRMNAVPGQQLLHIFFPAILTSEDMDQRLVDETMDWFESKYPLTGRLRAQYNEASMQFVRDCSRIIATMDYLSAEMRHTYHLAFSLLILFDDISETLILLPDPEPMRAFRHNHSRVIHQQERAVARIDLSAISSFPRDLLDLSLLHEDIYRDLHQRIRRYGSENLSLWYARAWDYFMDGVMLERKVMDEATDGQLHKYSLEEMVAERAHSIGATVANSVCNSDWCARFLQPEDALIAMSESAICSESDGSTYFKERLANQRAGRVTAVNIMDWMKQVARLSEHDALVACFNNRNSVLKSMVDVLPHIQPHHRLRYQRAVHAVLVYNDYSLVGGRDQPNNRYGWFPAHKSQQEISGKEPAPIMIIDRWSCMGNGCAE